MRGKIGTQVRSAICVLLLLIGAFLIVALPQPAAAYDGEIAAPSIAMPSQTIADGDYIQYIVTVGSDTGIRRFDFSAVNATSMTVDITSTIWYFGSASFTANYSYQDDMVVVPGLMGDLPQDSEVDEVYISTIYGTKLANVFSFMDIGPYSQVLRTFLVPIDCLVYYKYYGNDTDGNHVEMTLNQTNIGWLQDVGQTSDESDFVYVVSGGGATITDYIGGGERLNIPPTLGGFPVVAIGYEAFAYSDSITSVIIPNSVTSMEDGNAFFACTAMISVTLGNGIEGPGMRAFAYCTALTSVTIPNGISHIDYSAFIGCTALASVILPSSINFMPELVFAYCTSLRSIKFLGLEAPSFAYSSWIEGDHPDLRGHAFAESDFPGPGGVWNGLTMGEVITFVGAPGQPENFNALGGLGNVELSWAVPNYTGSSPISNYRVYRSSLELGTYFLIASPSSFSYTDADVTEGETYWYKISAVNSVAEGAKTASLPATPFNIPDAPSDLQIIPGNGQITLSWSAPFDNGSPIDFYVIYQNEIALPFHPVNSTITVTGLNNGQDYYYGVAAHNAAGVGPQSYWVNATPFVTVPEAPTFGSVSVGPSMVQLVWTPNGDGNSPITSYKLYRSLYYEGPYALIASPTLIWYNDSAVVNGGNYWYEVTAVNEVGESDHSDRATARPADVPSAPFGLEAIIGNAQVALSWLGPSVFNGATVDYFVLYIDDVPQANQPTGQSTVVTGLINGFGYNFSVAAHNSVGIGPKSDPIYAIPLGVPDAPTIVSAIPGSYSVTLIWTEPSNDSGSPVTGYRLYVSTNSGSSYGLVASPLSLTYMNDGLTNHQTYWYKVSAVNAIGEGTKSTPVSVTIGLPGSTSHESGLGYAILVPEGWTVEDDLMIGDIHADTRVMAPMSNGGHPNIIVIVGSDPSIRDTQEYLNDQVQDLINGLYDQGTSVLITDSPQFLQISNHSAVIVGWDVAGTSIHQIIAMVIDSEHMRFWSITCTESVDDRANLDSTFNTIIGSFAITSVPGLTGTDIIILVVIAGAVGLAIIGAVAFVMTRKKCPRCGAKIDKDWTTCGNCGQQLKGMPPSP